MYFPFVIYKLELLCTVILALVAIIGDCLVNYSKDHVLKAIFDNVTHSIIGGLTWLIVTLKYRIKQEWIQLAEIFLCAFIASIIDIDHFIAAKSLKLKDATNLQGRSFLHCSTIPIVVTIALLFLAKITVSENLYRFAWILFAAFSSHHIRDSTRRGLWFYTVGSTTPLPYILYIIISMTIPQIITIVMKMFYIQDNILHATYYNNIIDI